MRNHRVVILLVISIYLIGCVFSSIAVAEEEPFYTGLYYVGKDFKAGSYIIHLNETISDHPIAWITIYENEENYLKDDYLVYQDFSVEGYHLVVSEGMVFNIKLIVGFGGVLTISNETPSWMIVNN